MKRTYLVLFVAMALGVSSIHAQLFKDVKKMIGTSNSGFTEKEAADGIKEALVKGTAESVNLVSIADGFWGNDDIRIPFPSEAKTMENKLRSIGMDRQVDEFNVSMNRAAEKAASEAQPIFVAAIKNMTVKDAVNIVRGDDNAATLYLQNSTSPELNTKFKPIIEDALQSVDATKYWAVLVTTYNRIPMVKKMDSDLAQYVTGKSIDGLFVMIAKEEIKIRKNPAAQTSSLLKKVFGN